MITEKKEFALSPYLPAQPPTGAPGTTFPSKLRRGINNHVSANLDSLRPATTRPISLKHVINGSGMMLGYISQLGQGKIEQVAAIHDHYGSED